MEEKRRNGWREVLRITKDMVTTDTVSIPGATAQFVIDPLVADLVVKRLPSPKRKIEKEPQENLKTGDKANARLGQGT